MSAPHNHAHLHDNKQHPVIDSLESSRQSHGQDPFPHNHYSTDVTDQILEQAEAVHLPNAASTGDAAATASYPSSSSSGFAFVPAAASKPSTSSPSSTSPPSTSAHQAGSPPQQQQKNLNQSQNHDGPLIGLSTTATLPSTTWQPLVNKSSNQLPAHSVVDTSRHESQHDKPSVLPEILPGFKGRMADIHQATLKSVSDVPSSSSSSASTVATAHEGGSGAATTSLWSGGTMFPAMMPTFKNPFSNSSNNNNSGGHHASSEKDHHLAKSSILYESATEEPRNVVEDQHLSTTHAGADLSTSPSSTLVQGGAGGRRWSHELSPEKSGLVGSVVEAAALIKDVVLDKIKHAGPTSTASSSSSDTLRHHLSDMSATEIEEAAKVAFGGGADESGNHSVFLEGSHRHATAVDSQASAAAAAATTSTATVKDLLGSAPHAGQEHQKSIFHLAGNPEMKRSLLLDHPESLGYHSRDPTLGPFEDAVSPLSAQHRLGSGQSQLDRLDPSKNTR